MKTLISTASIILGLSYSTLALAHGYVSQPKSRSLLCKEGNNVNCGAVQYEPQSVEGSDGFPETGAEDGKIAAAGSAAWGSLNEQTASRWFKNSIKSGLNTFSWHFTAPHVTKDWKYYITKSDWNPNQGISRQSFDLQPFCSIDGSMAKPPVDISHECDIPDRAGYHLILALWDVGDTAATFYQIIDVDINGTNPGSGSSNDPSTGDSDGSPNLPTSDDCDSTQSSQLTPTVHELLCSAKPFSGADDDWCDMNCNQKPSFCPKNLCICH